MRIRMICLITSMCLCIAVMVCKAVPDGLGSNHIEQLQVSSIELGGETRSVWPGRIQTAGGGPWDYRTQGSNVFWTPMVFTNGTLQNVRVQTDQGNADVIIVRSNWQDSWDAYQTIGSFTASNAGTTFNSWSSSTVSNGTRLGIAVTSHTTGTNLWWSIEYTQ